MGLSVRLLFTGKETRVTQLVGCSGYPGISTTEVSQSPNSTFQKVRCVGSRSEGPMKSCGSLEIQRATRFNVVKSWVWFVSFGPLKLSRPWRRAWNTKGPGTRVGSCGQRWGKGWERGNISHEAHYGWRVIQGCSGCRGLGKETRAPRHNGQRTVPDGTSQHQ